MAKSTTSANNTLDWQLGGATPTRPTTRFISMHTADPGSAGTSAAAAGSTSRSQVTFSAASGGAIALTGTQPTWTNGGTTETITHISVWSASTSGNFLWSAQLSASKSWASGDTLTLTSCGLSLSPLAS